MSTAPNTSRCLRWLKPLLSTRLVEIRLGQGGARTAAADGCRGRGTRPVAERADEGSREVKRLIALAALVTMVAACSGKESGEAEKPSPAADFGCRHARSGPRDREGGLHLRLPDGRHLPRAIRLFRRQAEPGVQGRLERDPQHRTRLHAAGQGDPDAELGHPLLGRRCGPAHRAAGAHRPADRAGPLLLAPVRRRLHLQFPLRRQPHHRQRRRQIPSGRPELERRQSPRASTRSSARTPTWRSCCTARSCSARPTSTTSSRSRRDIRSRRCRSS